MLWSPGPLPKPRLDTPVMTARKSHPKPDLEAPDPGLRLPLALRESGSSCLGNGNCHRLSPISYRDVTRRRSHCRPRPRPRSPTCSPPTAFLLGPFLVSLCSSPNFLVPGACVGAEGFFGVP